MHLLPTTVDGIALPMGICSSGKHSPFKLPSAHIPHWLDRVDVCTADSHYKSKFRNSQNYKHKTAQEVAWVFIGCFEHLGGALSIQEFGGLPGMRAICMLPGLPVKQIQEAPFGNGLIRNSLYAVLGITAFQLTKMFHPPQRRDSQVTQAMFLRLGTRMTNDAKEQGMAS